MKAAMTAIADPDPQANFYVNSLLPIDGGLQEYVEAMGFDIRLDFARKYPPAVVEAHSATTVV